MGIDRIVRREIAGVLEDLVQRGTIDEAYALSFLQYAYLDNPTRVFGL